MKIRFTLLAAAAAMLLTAQAQPLTFNMGHDEGARILNQGVFNPKGMFIGNTGVNTIIEIGEVDFGAGDVFKAASIRFANGYNDGGTATLSAGETYDTALPFAAMSLVNFHNSYTMFRSLGANFTDTPTGVKKVYLTFADRAGNILDVRFYEDEFDASAFENGSMLKEPAQIEGYADVATILDINDSQLIVPYNDETRPDNGSWGWTGPGCVVKYGTVDFGEGEFDQVVLELNSHWQGDQTTHFVHVYLDDYETEANCIASVWCGIDIRDNVKTYLARNIEEITGEHTVYLVWQDGSNNIANVHFSKGMLWSLGNRADMEFINNYVEVNETPSENAVCYSFRASAQDSEDAVYIGRNSGLTEILYQQDSQHPQWEDNNLGWTYDGLVLKIKNIDFGDGKFDKVLVTHATGASGMTYEECSNFKFYLDTDVEDAAAVTGAGAPARIATVTDWSKAHLQLADVDPVATVKLQYTGGWGTEKTTIGDLSKVEGVHDVYMVYTCGDGANVKDIYLDDQEEDTPTAVTTITAVKAVNNNVYTIDGRLVRKNASSLEGLASGLYIFNGQKYIVK